MLFPTPMDNTAIHRFLKQPSDVRSAMVRELHIVSMKNRTSKGAATQIINPARLSPYLADNICMACHQTGDVRVLQPGKSYQDVRPGHPLDDTLSILMI